MFYIDSTTYWIDVCQSNGNLLVSAGAQKLVRIFDKRESKIVQTFDGIHTSNNFWCVNKEFLTSNCYYIGTIFCVRWSPSSDMIASASGDETAALLDFETGKKLYTRKTSDGSKCYYGINNNYSIIFRWCEICLLHVSNNIS